MKIKCTVEEFKKLMKKEPRGNETLSFKLGDSEIIQFKDHILVCSNRIVIFDPNGNTRKVLAAQQK